MRKVLLYSGGMDSWLIDQLWKPDVKLYIDIHGKYSEAERSRLPQDVKIVDFPLLGEFELENAHIPMRNLYFLMIASNYGERLCLGATAGDGGKDKSEAFLMQAGRLLKELWDEKKCSKAIAVETEFVKKYKTDLLHEYIDRGGDIQTVKEQTFSCYTPQGDKECFDCFPCFRKFAILYSNGAQYTDEEKRRMWSFVKRKVIPTREQGGYEGTYYTDRGRESEDLVKAVEMLRKEMQEG